MFSLFSKKEHTIPYTNKIYRTLTERRAALLKYTMESGSRILIICHFPAEREITEELLKKENIKYYYPDGIYTGIFSDHSILLIDADMLVKHAADLPALTIFIAEHHPQWTADKKLLDAIAKIPTALPPVFFVALDEPFMLAFGGERVARLMDALGMKENENVEHTLVDKSIRKAQEKVDKKNRTPMAADSQEKWMRLNIL